MTRSKLRACIGSHLFAALALFLPHLSAAQVARMEILSFQSRTLPDKVFLTGGKEGTAVTLTGSLRLPSPGTEKLAVIVLLHGSGGISGYVTDWEQEFNEMGLATFVVDSFTGRGLTTLVFDQSLTGGRLTQLYDAYRAFEVLEKHPRIDPARIAVMGFSRGGQASLYAGAKRFQRMHGPASGREFAAYIALYPTCNVVYHADQEVTSKPIRIHHGSADNYVPVKSCREYAQRLKAQGADIEHTEYPNANHVFDWKALREPVRVDKGQTTRKCVLQEGDNGEVMNVGTGQPFSYGDSCVEYGVTIAYDEAASVATRKAVKEFVSAVLKP